MNDNVAKWKEKIRNLVRNNPGELRLMDKESTLRMTDRLANIRDGKKIYRPAGMEVDQRRLSNKDWGARRRAAEDDQLSGSDQFD